MNLRFVEGHISRFQNKVGLWEFQIRCQLTQVLLLRHAKSVRTTTSILSPSEKLPQKTRKKENEFKMPIFISKCPFCQELAQCGGKLAQSRSMFFASLQCWSLILLCAGKNQNKTKFMILFYSFLYLSYERLIRL